MSSRFLVLIGAVALAACDRTSRAEEPPALAVGFGVDTAPLPSWGDFGWTRPVPEIYRAWRDHLAFTSTDSAGVPIRSAHWSAAEQREWPLYDLARTYDFRGLPATVVDVRPATPGATDEYIVRTLFSSTGDAPRTAGAPLALVTVYATREGGRWVFSNALSRLTRDWRRATVGPITYVIEPGYAFDSARASRAVAFADSLAGAFDVPGLGRVTYYLTSTPDAMNRIMGRDWTVTPGGRGGGMSVQSNAQIFSGDPALGEEYRHELVHFVLSPLGRGRRSHGMIGEGVATWLGGTIGMNAPETLRAYARFLRANPAVTLDSVLGPMERDLGYRPAGALLCLMVHERGGVAAVKELIVGGSTDEELKRTLERLLGRKWPQIAADWRAKALTY